MHAAGHPFEHGLADPLTVVVLQGLSEQIGHETAERRPSRFCSFFKSRRIDVSISIVVLMMFEPYWVFFFRNAIVSGHASAAALPLASLDAWPFRKPCPAPSMTWLS